MKKICPFMSRPMIKSTEYMGQGNKNSKSKLIKVECLEDGCMVWTGYESKYCALIFKPSNVI